MRKALLITIAIAGANCRTISNGSKANSNEPNLIGNTVGSQFIQLGNGYYLSDFAGQSSGVEVARNCLKFDAAGGGAGLSLTGDGTEGEVTKIVANVPPGQSQGGGSFALADDHPNATTLKPDLFVGNQDSGYFLLTSSRAVETAVDVGVKVGVQTPVVQVGVDSKTNVENSSKSDGINFVIYTQFVKNAKTIDQPVLRDEVAADVVRMVDGKPRIDTVKFFERCGQAMVSQVVYGAKIAAQLSIQSEQVATQVKQALNVDVKYGNSLTRQMTSVDVNTAINVAVKNQHSSEAMTLRVKASGIPDFIEIPTTEVIRAGKADAVINLINSSLKNRQDLGIAYGVLNSYGYVHFKYNGEWASDFVESPLNDPVIQSFLVRYKAEAARTNDALLALADLGVAEGSENEATLKKVQDYRGQLDNAFKSCLVKRDAVSCVLPSDGLKGLKAVIPTVVLNALRYTANVDTNEPSLFGMADAKSKCADGSGGKHMAQVSELVRLFDKNEFWKNMVRGPWSDVRVWTSSYADGKRQMFSIPRYLSGQDPQDPMGDNESGGVVCICDTQPACY